MNFWITSRSNLYILIKMIIFCFTFIILTWPYRLLDVCFINTALLLIDYYFMTMFLFYDGWLILSLLQYTCIEMISKRIKFYCISYRFFFKFFFPMIHTYVVFFQMFTFSMTFERIFSYSRALAFLLPQKNAVVYWYGAWFSCNNLCISWYL